MTSYEADHLDDLLPGAMAGDETDSSAPDSECFRRRPQHRLISCAIDRRRRHPNVQDLVTPFDLVVPSGRMSSDDKACYWKVRNAPD